jgi:signal transduction histidine kinase
MESVTVMESILNTIFNAENGRMLVILAFVSCAYVLMRSQMKEMGYLINKRIDELSGTMNGRIDELKHNDIAHLNSAIEALTYALEKNGSLKHEDKEYVDSRLTH